MRGGPFLLAGTISNVVYVYNPTNVPHIIGKLTFPPKNYSVVTEEEAARVRQAKTPLVIEGDSDFPGLWAIYRKVMGYTGR